MAVLLISIQVSNFRVTPSDHLPLGDGSDSTGVGTHRLDISEMIWHLAAGAASAAGSKNETCSNRNMRSRENQSCTDHTEPKLNEPKNHPTPPNLRLLAVQQR